MCDNQEKREWLPKSVGSTSQQSDPYMYVCYAFQATQELLFGYRYNFLNKSNANVAKYARLVNLP